MEWTQEQRYRSYQDWPADYLEHLKNTIQASNWRLNYHIQPVTGLLNDPNGFSFFNGEWHLFYQAFPFGAVHGLKSWYHVSSSDLIHWEEKGLALAPDSVYDAQGVYSGSGLPVGEKLFLAYTGNVRDQACERHSYQLGAWMDTDGVIEKFEEPLIKQMPEGITAHFRDPQIIRYKETYLMIIGAQTTGEKGTILVYESYDLREWRNLGTLAISQDLGFMVECPNLLFIEDKILLLLCPQGLNQKTLPYQNVYPNTYILADAYKKETNSLENPAPQQLLDEGFDLYATQAFTAPDGRCLSIGWIGLPEMSYPTFEEGWAHCLSLVKELKIIDGQLLQYPVAETKKLRKSHEQLIVKSNEAVTKETTNCYELEMVIPKNTQGVVQLFADEKGEQSLLLTYDTTTGKVRLDRRKTAEPLNPAFGETRETVLKENSPLHLRLFVDHSTCELFFNHGLKSMTAAYYATPQQRNLFVRGNRKFQLDYYLLEK